MEKAKAYLESLVQPLVEFPEEIRIESRTDEMGILLSLHLAPSDMGRIIGREGTTAKAVRTLLRVVGMQNNARVNLKIVEPEGGRYNESHDSNEG